MSQHEQMREALQTYLDAGHGQHTDPVLQLHAKKLAEKAFAAKPAKLVRLTDEKIEEIGRKLLDRGHPWEGLQPWVYVFAKCIMDEMERLNVGAQPFEPEHHDYRVKTQDPKRPLPPPTTGENP